MELCKSCGQPCLGVGTEDHTYGLPTFLWEADTQSGCVTLSPGEECGYFFNRSDPPWGARHGWRQDDGGQWFFVERLDDGDEIHCPVAGEGVFPTLQEWEVAVTAHEEMLR